MKRVAILLVLILVFSFILVVQAQEEKPPDRYSLHQVQAGDTLWAISQRYMPEIDPRQGIGWVKQANGLDGAIIQPGDILNIPDKDGPLIEPLGPRYTSEAAAKAADEEINKLLGFKKEPVEPELEPVEVEIRPANTASRGREYREMTVEATAYTAGLESTGKSPGDPAYGITKSGFEVDSGVIAVDPSVIPLGSICWVEGYGYAVALDTGGAIKGKKIDVFFHEVDDAVEWGRKQVKVRVY